ncbi:MAG TPA: aldo/keto reductase [Candidatus Blautia merdavium]|uniref:Aldo/keto reductase n=1 Tax=Candidatus Blautia merdavium TaxID=2838494 RepID=A0A9D2PNZ2_9FIRM|nr:aldo/keto reductase [Candidatus Blautia merdavium]
MEYRQFEKLGVSPSLLGFGCMRFPQNPDGSICEPEAEKMLDTAIQAGVSYIDTAYPYHNGDSEPFVGRVLKKYDRSRLFLATKLPVWNVKTLDDAKRLFQEQLDRLQTDYVDFYLLHCLDQEKWQLVLDLGLIPYFEEMKKEGKIRFFGFSFHDDFEVFKTILTYRNWDFCQIQYNYVDTDIQAGDRGYELAEELGVPLVIMEPVKGGSLAALPEEVTEPFRSYKPDASISSWALRWVASKPNVKVVLSGMSDMEQVNDNLQTFGSFQPLSLREKELVADVAAAIKKRTKNGCTGCAYCMPCPFGVNIPQNFRIWNDLSMYGNVNRTRQAYFKELEESARADQCQKCGKCEEVCPQSLSIRENLEAAAKEMDALK